MDYKITKEEIDILMKAHKIEGIKNMFNIVDVKFKRQLVPKEKFMLVDFIDKYNAEIEDIIMAVDIATKKNIRNMGYIEGVLKNITKGNNQIEYYI